MLPVDAVWSVWQQWVVECAVSAGQWAGLGRYQAGNLLHCPTWSSLAPTPSTPRHSYTPPLTPPGQILIPLPAGGDILPGTHLRMCNISFRNLKTCHYSLKVAAYLILPPEQFVPPATCAGVYPPLTGGLVRAARSGHWAQWSSRSW